MTLSAAVQLRVRTALLIELTNKNSKQASSIGTTVLDAAIADAKEEFQTETGVTFDETDAAHIGVGWRGVMFYLFDYIGRVKDAANARSAWERAMAKFATGRGAERRLLPTTTSARQQSTRVTGSLISQDNTRWSDFVPNSPRGDLDAGDDIDGC